MTMKDRWFFLITGAILLGCAVLMAVTWPAGASEPEPFSYRAYRKDLYWRNYYCRDGRYHPEGCDTWRWRRHRAAHNRRSYDRDDDNGVCRRVIEATGEQAQSKDSAEALALRNWQGRVRFHHGEKFITFENARDRKITCSASSVADTVGGKIQEKLLGVSHFRCELSARPCAARARAINGRDD